MATINIDILDAACEDGVFNRGCEPTDLQQRYYPSFILTAWSVLSVIEQCPQGISAADITDRLPIGRSTVIVYCQWLKERELVEWWQDCAALGRPIYYFPLGAGGKARGSIQIRFGQKSTPTVAGSRKVKQC